MKTSYNTAKESTVIAMSSATKAKIATIAKNLQGQELFQAKKAAARKIVTEVKNLPI